MRFHCLAIVAPEWLLAHSQPEWVDRYGVRLEDSRLPSGEEERQAWVQSVGQDGTTLLSALFEPDTPSWLAQVPAVEILRRVWVQNYQGSEGELGWRSSENIPPAGLYISSPYDLDAHYSKKRTTSWVGFKVHLTETCEKDNPHLITHVETTTAPFPMMPERPPFMKGSSRKSCCPSNISSIRAMSMPSYSTAVSRILTSIWLVLPVPMSNGKLRRKRALRRASFRSIGRQSKLPVPKATRV